MSDTKRVIPLEANPEIFNSLSYKLGLSPVLLFVDVYSLTDPDLLAFLPQPVLGLIMLFPITDKYEQYRKKEDKIHANESKEVHWFKQTIGNGCGLYALLHILANLPSDFIVKDLLLNALLLSHIKKDSTLGEVATLVELLEQHVQLDSNYGIKGQTEAPPIDESVEFHFITYVKGSDQHIYELDGRRSGPVDLGLSNEDRNILSSSVLVDKIQFYMSETDEDQRNNFALMAIAPAL